MVDLAEPSQTPLCFAVIGNPVAHSYSPRIHHQFAEQFGITLEYKKLLAEPGHFSEAVLDFCSTGGRGLNVTVPFKVDAWQFAQSLSDRARVAEAVNTLLFNSDGIAFGDNTDGAGLLQDIRHNLNFDLKGKRVLILGAGGAVRGILGPLIDASPAKMTIANRTARHPWATDRCFTRQNDDCKPNGEPGCSDGRTADGWPQNFGVPHYRVWF